MDAANPYETPNTYKLHKAEYLIGFAASIVAIATHLGDINCWVFAGLFLYIDIIRYIPGAIAYRRSPDHQVSRGYYIAYNIMHSLITQSVVVVLWSLAFGWEWALLAIPFHLFGDRGLFGNFLKPFDLPFEPVPNPMYQRLLDSMRDVRPVPAVPEAAPVSPAVQRR